MGLIRNVGTIGGLTAISRVFGFARDMLLARVLGAGLAADAFQLAFTLPNTFRRLFVAGLATDYCVRATGSDARRAGLDVVVLRDAVAAVEARPGDGERALGELAQAGCMLATTDDVLAAMETSR